MKSSEPVGWDVIRPREVSLSWVSSIQRRASSLKGLDQGQRAATSAMGGDATCDGSSS